MGRTRSTYVTIQKCTKKFRGKPEGKKPSGKPRRRWKDNIKVDFREVACDAGDWMYLA